MLDVGFGLGRQNPPRARILADDDHLGGRQRADRAHQGGVVDASLRGVRERVRDRSGTPIQVCKELRLDALRVIRCRHGRVCQEWRSDVRREREHRMLCCVASSSPRSSRA